MTTSKTTSSTVRRPFREILILAGVVVAVLLVVQAFAGSRFASASGRGGWLSQFEGGPVAVTFVKAPPGKSLVAQGLLISAEVSGLVLRFPKEPDKFFCYANIISVDPK